ncbi:hypothetical protein AL035_21580 [Salipiger aestuarii]|nr:hypothetical protein AL035_21580 [Salipiger aestuarii]
MPAPNVLWVSDFTCVATWKGFVYVVFVIDALEQAVQDRRPGNRRVNLFCQHELVQQRPFLEPRAHLADNFCLLFRLFAVIMRCTLNPKVRLVRHFCRFKYASWMAGWHRIIGAIFDQQKRTSNLTDAFFCVGTRMIW